MSAPRVHLDRDGHPRCGRGEGYPVTADESAVDCQMCLNILAGINHGGIREDRLKPCGTPAAARRHARHGEPLCDACRAYESRRYAAYKEANRDLVNARARAKAREQRKQKRAPVLFDPAQAEVVARLIEWYAPDAAELLADMIGLAA